MRRQLDLLEEPIGLTLLNRSRDGVSLTPAGEGFLVRARQLLGAARELVLYAKEASKSPRGRSRLGLQVGYPPAIANRLNRALYQKFTDRQIDGLLDEGTVDTGRHY